MKYLQLFIVLLGILLGSMYFIEGRIDHRTDLLEIDLWGSRQIFIIHIIENQLRHNIISIHDIDNALKELH